MEILLWLVFIIAGALWMKNNVLSWVDGAFWGGFLTFVVLIIFYFRIRSSKKKPLTSSEPQRIETSESIKEDSEQISSYLRSQATKQILYGLAWWCGSAVAMYVALQSTGNTVYWFGGALGALFHWYRAFKIFELSRKSNLSLFAQKDYLLIAVTVLIAVGSFSKIVPEYFRIDIPTIGTCWAEAENGKFAPVACWSPDAEAKTVSFANTPEACGTDSYFGPSASESRYTCIEEKNTSNTNA